MTLCHRVDVELGESEIDHVDDLFIGGQPNDAVPKLDVSVQDAARVHELQSGDLMAHVAYRQEKEAEKVGRVPYDRRKVGLTTCIAIQHTLRRSTTSFPLRRKSESRLAPRRSMTR